MKNTLFSSSLMTFSLLLAACGGSGGNNNVADKPQAPQTANSITGHIQKPGGGHEPVTTTSLDYTTYKGVLVSLREEDAVMNLEDRPANRGSMEVDGDYLGIKIGNGFGALRVYDGLSYARFGDISTYDTSSHTISDTVGFFQGTPSLEMQTGGTISYSGTAYQFGKTASGTPIADYKGKLNATADLSLGKIHIQLSNVTVPVEANATIRGNTFIEHSVVPGRGLVGGFFGPNAAEIAGIVQQTGNGEWTATFGGKR